MTSFIDGISLWVVGRCQYALNPQGAHELPPNVTHKFAAAVRQKAAGCTKVWHNMPEKSFTHRACGVIARGDKDGVPQIAIDKHDEEFLSVVGG